MAIKKKVAKKTDQPVIEPEVIGEVAEVEAEEFESNSVEMPVSDGIGEFYTVKLDNKRFERREFYQIHSLLEGARGTFKKVTIEVE